MAESPYRAAEEAATSCRTAQYLGVSLCGHGNYIFHQKPKRWDTVGLTDGIPLAIASMASFEMTSSHWGSDSNCRNRSCSSGDRSRQIAARFAWPRWQQSASAEATSRAVWGSLVAMAARMNSRHSAWACGSNTMMHTSSVHAPLDCRRISSLIRSRTMALSVVSQAVIVAASYRVPGDCQPYICVLRA